MISGTGTLIMLYVLLTAVLLVLLLTARWRWQIKAAVIVIASCFYVVPYLSWPQLMGWPTVDEMPDEFNVLGMYVQPPNRITGNDGVIYLWAAERFEAGRLGVPRAYKFGYAVKYREQMLTMGEKLKKGVSQAGKKSKKKDPGGKPGKFNLFGRLGQKSADLEFYDAPAPQLPDK